MRAFQQNAAITGLTDRSLFAPVHTKNLIHRHLTTEKFPRQAEFRLDSVRTHSMTALSDANEQGNNNPELNAGEK